MQNDKLKNKIKQILDELKADGNKLIKDFEKSLQEYQDKLAEEVSKPKTEAE